MKVPVVDDRSALSWSDHCSCFGVGVELDLKQEFNSSTKALKPFNTNASSIFEFLGLISAFHIHLCASRRVTL